MGQEINQTSFTDAEVDHFRNCLREETATLKKWFDERAFEYADQPDIGLELEGWLVDENYLPAPMNEAFLKEADDPDIVEELSKFNFEVNAPPQALNSACFTATEADLNRTWAKCVAAADRLNLKPCAIGIMPTVRDEMLQTEWLSDANRYQALNDEILRRRKGKPLHIDIKGYEHLDYHCDHIMLEAACTSLQSHLKINQEDAVRFYNAGVLAAGPLVAATANSAYLYGKSLWAETRIPAFEQATALEGYRDASGNNVLRVTLGTGYIRHSFLELFLANLSYPPLLPAIVENRAKLPHLKLQNGTVWRWVRPILGFNKEKVPHLRIEHRVMPAGPSIVDTVANLALCHGLMFALAKQDTPPELETPYEDVVANFYACAKDGLRAKVRWRRKSVDVQSLLLDELIPMARTALEKEGVSADDLDKFFTETLIPRIRSGRTGANWQRRYVELNGTNRQALAEAYMAHQATGKPVHDWTV